ncbi:heme exporter protein CcmD [Breoghania sp. L-A4]|uniref:heme exporter protein CcmD n=1 Tax=Breoghania sp. L-A4 TaxID=2304600 RepID=UPI000E35CCA1|nr:heme exporter protein CcmD [Breoghania sp. L-A4]AXS38918.1 heme exporter protein CcmD [Breoghania sp. L-A4]
MTALGPHSAYILASYAISLAVVLGVIVWVLADQRRQKRALSDLEARGITRRSRGKAAREQAAADQTAGERTA